MSGIRITDSDQSLEYVFGCRNMKKAVILDPNTKKNQVMDIFSFILKNLFKKASLNGDHLNFEFLA